MCKSNALIFAFEIALDNINMNTKIMFIILNVNLSSLKMA